jgi:hypothetical protein
MSDRVVELADGRADEAGALSDLSLRSKAHWGYGAAFLEACRDELTLTPEQAARTRVVRDSAGTVMGFHRAGAPRAFMIRAARVRISVRFRARMAREGCR